MRPRALIPLVPQLNAKGADIRPSPPFARLENEGRPKSATPEEAIAQMDRILSKAGQGIQLIYCSRYDADAICLAQGVTVEELAADDRALVYGNGGVWIGTQEAIRRLTLRATVGF
jgi:hypothetical protein